MQRQKSEDHYSRLIDVKVGDLMADKRRLVEVPHNATFADTLNAMVANRVSAIPVAAPPGQWIGAGGSMIVESDKLTGVVRKHYIGMVTMLDIIAHIAEEYCRRMDGRDDPSGDGGGGPAISGVDRKMAARVSSIIGHCPEGLSLWTLNPNTSILDCIEMFSKGIHRALVPVGNHSEDVSGVELVASASGYRMLTQMDLMKFLNDRSSEIVNIISRPAIELGAVNDEVYAITDQARVVDAIKCMSIAMLNAVPIVQASGINEEDQTQLVNGRHRKLIGTFSASDLKSCHLATLQTWLPLTALEFAEKIPQTPLFAAMTTGTPATRELVTCQANSPLAEVIYKVMTKHVHRVWVVDQQGRLEGLVSLTDIIRAIRSALLSIMENE